MQWAHYTRMLQSCGYHPVDELLIGAIIGTNQVRIVPEIPAELVLA